MRQQQEEYMEQPMMAEPQEEFVAPNNFQTSDPLVSIENMKFMLENGDFDELYLELGGFDRDEKGNLIKKGPAMMNAEGIAATKSYIKLAAGKSSKISKIDAYNISRIIIDFSRKYAYQLAFCLNKWQINRTDYLMLHMLVTNYVYFAIKRSEDAHEKWFLRASQNSLMAPQATAMQMMPQYKGGSSWNPFRRN